MRQLRGLVGIRAMPYLGEGPAGLIVMQHRERGERLPLPGRPEPATYVTPRARLPLFEQLQHMHVPHQRHLQREVEHRPGRDRQRNQAPERCGAGHRAVMLALERIVDAAEHLCLRRRRSNLPENIAVSGDGIAQWHDRLHPSRRRTRPEREDERVQRDRSQHPDSRKDVQRP